MAPDIDAPSSAHCAYTNYVAYRAIKDLSKPRIGSLDLENSIIQPLAFASGTTITNLYQVIEAGESNIAPVGTTIPLSSVELLSPLSERDVITVENGHYFYAEKTNSSKYNSFDRIDGPSFLPKRATSIIASGEPIFSHPNLHRALGCEGKLGVIIGKRGFRIEEKNAWEYVWGYTIVNDVTARDCDGHGDHNRAFTGISADTFCPMGPIAVPAQALPKIFHIKTDINGISHRNHTTSDLAFSIPSLIANLSSGMTLQPGDIIATSPASPSTSTPILQPPQSLEPGDIIEVSISGLSTLRNEISSLSNQVPSLFSKSQIPIHNNSKTCSGSHLTLLDSKPLHYRHIGLKSKSSSAIIFIHGLGSSIEFFTPLISALSLTKTHSLHLLDLEGHGLSPTSATSTVSISSYAADVYAMAKYANLLDGGATVIAHSMGALIAVNLTLAHPELIKTLIFLAPSPPTIPSLNTRAPLIRASGLAPFVDSMITATTSLSTRTANPVALAAIRMSLLGSDPEGYAKGCGALATAPKLPIRGIEKRTLILVGEEDMTSPPALGERYAREIRGADCRVLKKVGHWVVFEDCGAVAQAVREFLQLGGEQV